MTQPDTTTRARVLVADGDGLARRMLREALQEAPTMTVVASAADMREACELARYLRPEVLIADVSLPSGGGTELTRTLAREVPGTNVVLLAAAEDDDEALAALQAGAAGYVGKDLEPAMLAALVTKVAAGEAAVSRRLMKRVLERLRDVPDAGWRPVRSRLTTREWEIVDLLAAGESTPRMAQQLVLSQTTVYSHVKSLMRKLGVHSRSDAVAVAERLRREEAVGRNLPGEVR
jgi:DNA-binding NarL/FixJ family response regulator